MVSQMIDDLRARGMVAQVSNEDELIEHLSSGMRTVYCGLTLPQTVCISVISFHCWRSDVSNWLAIDLFCW